VIVYQVFRISSNLTHERIHCFEFLNLNVNDINKNDININDTNVNDININKIKVEEDGGNHRMLVSPQASYQ
jgi:hypothetical protein